MVKNISKNLYFNFFWLALWTIGRFGNDEIKNIDEKVQNAYDQIKSLNKEIDDLKNQIFSLKANQWIEEKINIGTLNAYIKKVEGMDGKALKDVVSNIKGKDDNSVCFFLYFFLYLYDNNFYHILYIVLYYFLYMS